MRLLLVLVRRREPHRSRRDEVGAARWGGMERARVVITDPPRAKMCRHQLCHKGPSMLEGHHTTCRAFAHNEPNSAELRSAVAAFEGCAQAGDSIGHRGRSGIRPRSTSESGPVGASRSLSDAFA